MQEEKTAAAYARHHMLRMRIEPGLAIENVQGHAAPLQVVGAMRIAIDLDMHHQRVGLLNLADPTELHLVAETGAEFVASGEGAEVSSRDAGQDKENRRRAQHDQERKQGRSASQRKGHLPVSQIVTR